MMKKAIALIVTISGSLFSWAFPIGKIAFRVVVMDESTSLPIKNVSIKAVFDDIPVHWGDGSVEKVERGMTDSKGMCRFTGTSNHGKGGYIIENMQGYYAASFVNYVATNGVRSFFPVHYRCEPYNCVYTTALQRIECPIPLAVKQFAEGGSDSVSSDLFAKGNGCLQLDMMKGEWLPPVGNGDHADVEFRRLPRENLGIGTNFNGRTGTAYRDSMAVMFLGEENGMVEVSCSEGAGIKIRTAPQDGYRNEYVCWKGRMNDLKYASHFDKRRNFAFRIRTRRDENGKITSAYYGKIYGDINFKKLFGVDVEAVAAPSFLYYLNPTPLDRNLEWDMKTNLCPKPGNVGKQP